MDLLRVGLQVHKEDQVFAKYSWCEFWLRSMAFLDHIIFSYGIEVDPMKNEVVKKCPRPLTPINIKRLLCLVRYYRSFVDGVLSITSAFTTFIQKSVKFQCS